MKRGVRSLANLLWLLGIFATLLAYSMPALAQEDTTTTTATTAPAAALTPAVPIEPPTEVPTTPDWTYRYLIPTGLVLAALVIVITSIRYFTNVVRKRYRIVEE